MNHRAAVHTFVCPNKCRVLRVRDRGLRSIGADIVDSLTEALASGIPVIVLCEPGNIDDVLESRRCVANLDDVLRSTATAFDARVSRSATHGMAAWAACATGPIGVDVQSPPDVLDDDLLAVALSGDEHAWLLRQPHRAHAFATLWAGKEAVLKAFGVGLAWSPCRVDVVPIGEACTWQRVSVAALGVSWLSYPCIDGAPASIPLAVALNAGHA